MEAARWLVVGVDFSEGADRALECAIALAAGTSTRIACVHAYEDCRHVAPPDHDPEPALQSDLADTVARSAAGANGVRVETFVRRGAPWDKLVNVASELGAQLIMVGAK